MIGLLLAISPAAAQERPALPPVLPWSGKSERSIARMDDPWITPAEWAGFRKTPSHEETRAWLEKLVAASPLLALENFGKSAEGRDLYHVRASSGSNRPVVLIQAGIHAGEIDGKDAGLMLLRDIALRGKADLLDKVDLVFVPIYNADGHERASPRNFPHLRGPDNPGTVATAQGLNLNRDYAKADAPETQAMLSLLRRLDPVLYIDMHVSEGFDHAYDVTYTSAGWGRHFQSQAITEWLNGPFHSGVDAFLRGMGHNPHFYPSANDDRDLDKGLRIAAEGPRYSTGYGDFARIPTVLVEMHNLKPYRQRVLGAYAMMEAALRQTARDLPHLQGAISRDRAERPETLALRWQRDDSPLEWITFSGVAHETYRSPATGEMELRYLARPRQLRIPVFGQKPVLTVTLPEAWWVPAGATEVIRRLDLHGIAYERIEAPRTLDLDMVRLIHARPGPVIEGRMTVGGEMIHETRRETMPSGSLRIPRDQPRGLLAAELLEPEAVDSFLAWGFFPGMIQMPDTPDRLASLSVAEELLRADPQVRAQFESRLAQDAQFANDADARLAWLVAHTPFGDDRAGLYPIGREL